MRAVPLTDWTSETDPVVRECLQVKCKACDSSPGQHCASIVDNLPLPGGRLVHFFRRDTVIANDKEPT